jgi:hypothetical protein
VRVYRRFSLTAHFWKREVLLRMEQITLTFSDAQLTMSIRYYAERSPPTFPLSNPLGLLAINLLAAKALGLTVPPALLARADEVIE